MNIELVDAIDLSLYWGFSFWKSDFEESAA